MKYFEAFLESEAPDPVTRKECYPRDLYDPVKARSYALSEEALTPVQRANLLSYAKEAEKATRAILKDAELDEFD